MYSRSVTETNDARFPVFSKTTKQAFFKRLFFKGPGRHKYTTKLKIGQAKSIQNWIVYPFHGIVSFALPRLLKDIQRHFIASIFCGKLAQSVHNIRDFNFR